MADHLLGCIAIGWRVLTYRQTLTGALTPLQASTSVQHLALPCHWTQRTTVVGDLVRCYGALGRSIIFCETKRDCNDLAAALGEAMRARALHGDIPQQQREVRGHFV